MRRPPSSPLFPYTTLFRSYSCAASRREVHVATTRPPARPAAIGTTACRTTSVPIVRRDAPSATDRKSTRLNSSHGYISYAVFCLKKKKRKTTHHLLYQLPH